MTKKKLDTGAISSELSRSVFFRDREPDQVTKVEPTPLPEVPQPEQQSVKSSGQAVSQRPTDQPTNSRIDQQSDRPTDQPTERPTDHRIDRFTASRQRRELQRIAFDLEKEQIRAIRKLKAERELKEGRDVSLSELGREAFDMYLNSGKDGDE